MPVVVLSPEAQEQADSLPKKVRARIFRLLKRLTDWPAVSGAKPLRGRLAGRFRSRTGDYRIQFRIEPTRIVVEKIGHRDRFYD